MEAQELNVDEAHVREIIERLIASGAPQGIETLTQWFIGAVINQRSGE